MPPHATITRPVILAAAIKVARRDGADALTARRISQELGCSTQPIYTAFDSMSELHAEVSAHAQRIADGYLSKRGGPDPLFLQVGLNGLRFAHEEPHLHALAMRQIRDRLDQPSAEILTLMRADPALRGLPPERLAQIHRLLWIFSQGLASMLGPGAPVDQLARAETDLRMMGHLVIHGLSGS